MSTPPGPRACPGAAPFLLALLLLSSCCGPEPPPAPGPPPAASPAPPPPAATPTPPPAATPALPAPPAPPVGIPPYPAAGTARPDAARRAAAKVWNDQGLTAYRARQYARAVELFTLALLEHPGHVVARYNLACNLHLAGRTADALAQLTELARADCGACRRQLLTAGADADFASLRSDPRFQALLLPPDAVGLAVDERRYKQDGELGFVTAGLPALARDGKTLLHTLRKEEGLRGRPNLTLVWRRVATDEVVQEREVLAAAEADAGIPAIVGKVRARLTKLNQELVGGGWVPLAHDLAAGGVQSCPDPGAAPAGAQQVRLGSLRVEYREPLLTVTESSGKVRLRREVPAWSTGPRCPGAETVPSADPTICPEPCFHAARLVRGALDEAERVLLLTVAYCGSDACPEPDPTHHALPLPASKELEPLRIKPANLR